MLSMYPKFLCIWLLKLYFDTNFNESMSTDLTTSTHSPSISASYTVHVYAVSLEQYLWASAALTDNNKSSVSHDSSLQWSATQLSYTVGVVGNVSTKGTTTLSTEMYFCLNQQYSPLHHLNSSSSVLTANPLRIPWTNKWQHNHCNSSSILA